MPVLANTTEFISGKSHSVNHRSNVTHNFWFFECHYVMVYQYLFTLPKWLQISCRNSKLKRHINKYFSLIIPIVITLSFELSPLLIPYRSWTRPFFLSPQRHPFPLCSILPADGLSHSFRAPDAILPVDGLTYSFWASTATLAPIIHPSSRGTQ